MSTSFDDLRKVLNHYLLHEVDETDSELLGSGSYGVVKTVKHQGKVYACKTFYDYLIGPLSGDKTKRALLMECHNAMRVNHINVVRSYGLYHPAKAPFPSIVMERLPYCLEKMLSQSSLLSELKPFILADVAKGLGYLHSCKIIHRDLTANNILLTDTFDAKISDFGQAKVIDLKEVKHTAVPGNPIYMPPEAKHGTELQAYDSSLDIFSYGVLILHTLLERLPLTEKEFVKDEQGRTIALPPLDYFREEIEMAFLTNDQTFRSLLERCLEEMPTRRPSTEELVLETEDIRIDKFIHFKRDYCELVLREKQTNNDLANLRTENKLLWRDLEKFQEIVKKTEKYKSLQQEASLQKKSQKFKSKQQEAVLHANSCSKTPNICSPITPPIAEPPVGEHATEDEDDDELMVSMKDVRLLQDSQTAILRQESSQTNGDCRELWEECKRLKEENTQLRNEVKLLHQEQQQEQSLTSSLKPSASLPPTVQKKRQRKLLEEDTFVTIEGIPQDSLSFNDIGGAHIVYCRGKVYVGRLTHCVWMYDTCTMIWRKVNEDAPVKNFGLAVYNDRVILVGGLTKEGRISKDIYALYEEDGEVWKPGLVKPMKQSRDNPAVAVSREYLITMGGTSTGFIGAFLSPLNTIDIYNGEEWRSTQATFDHFADAMQCFISSGYLYTLNSDGWKIRYCDVNVLTGRMSSRKKVNIWQSISRDIPYAHSCVFVYDDTLFAISGAASDGSLYGYDPDNDRWKRVPCTHKTLPAIRNATCLTIGDKQLFLCGGHIDMFNSATKVSFTLAIGTCTSTENSDQFNN